MPYQCEGVAVAVAEQMEDDDVAVSGLYVRDEYVISGHETVPSSRMVSQQYHLENTKTNATIQMIKYYGKVTFGYSHEMELTLFLCGIYAGQIIYH